MVLRPAYVIDEVETTSDRLQRVLGNIEWNEGAHQDTSPVDYDPTVTPARGSASVDSNIHSYGGICEKSHSHCRGCLGHTRREQTLAKWWRIVFGAFILWVTQWFGGLRLDPILFLWVLLGVWFGISFLMEGARRDKT